jgi:hypothetical protein
MVQKIMMSIISVSRYVKREKEDGIQFYETNTFVGFSMGLHKRNLSTLVVLPSRRYFAKFRLTTFLHVFALCNESGTAENGFS